MRGWLCAAMDKLPNDPQFLALDGEQLRFMYHWKRKYLNELRTDLGVMLGTHWTPEAVHAQSTGSRNGKFEYTDIPLALLLQPRLGKYLKSNIPKPGTSRNGEVEFEDVLGVNAIREFQRQKHQEQRQQQQRELLQEAAKLLEQ